MRVIVRVWGKMRVRVGGEGVTDSWVRVRGREVERVRARMIYATTSFILFMLLILFFSCNI